MAEKIEDRRGFLARASMGLLGLVGLTTTKNASKKAEKMPEQHTVLEVKPMGFQWDTLDPFLFCVHHEDAFPAGNAEMGPAVSLAGRHMGDDFIIKDGFRMYHGKRVPGFPGHPHRGFETITVVRDGIVDHADSLGASGRYGEGDVQWMTAGKGVQHSEMFPLLRENEPNPLELFQIWLNLPAKSKMVDPHFKMLWGSKIPHVKKDGLEIEVIAGTLFDETAPAPPPDSWAADPKNEVSILNIRLEKGQKLTLPRASGGINRVLYFYIGSEISVAGQAVSNYKSIVVRPEVDLEIQNSEADEAKILMLQGRPIGEQVMQYGPFVMNTKAEIQQAFEDFHATQFGGWPWSKYDQTHGRDEGRFAKHADGTFEKGV